MKNLSKTVCALSLLMTIACTEEPTLGPTSTTNTSTTTNNNVGSTDTLVIPGSVDTTVVISTTEQEGTDVLYSDWLTPGIVSNPTSGTSTGNGSGTSVPNGNAPATPTNIRYFNVLAPAITQEILDKGVVLAYCRLANDENKTRSLATTTMISGFISIWDFSMTVGKIQFIQSSANPFGIPAISSSNKFRYVIIPPTKHVRLSKPLKDLSYAEICARYNIPE